MEIKRYFARVLHREHCQLNDEGKLEKNLAILGEQVEHLILVDVKKFIHIECYNGEL